MTDDALEGYRGAANRSTDTEVEDEIAWLHKLRQTDLHTELLRAVVVSDELEKALHEDGSSIRRLVNHVVERLDAASRTWQSQADPNHVSALNAHREARAARLVLDWVQEILTEGDAAEKMLEQETSDE